MEREFKDINQYLSGVAFKGVERIDDDLVLKFAGNLVLVISASHYCKDPEIQLKQLKYIYEDIGG